MAIWIRRFYWLIIAYLVQRVLFIGFNLESLLMIEPLKFIGALVDGIRFDLCAIATVNLPIAAIHCFRFLPMRYKYLRWMDHSVGVLFLIVNIPLIIFGVVDSRLFAFTGRRINPDIFAIGGDIRGQSVGIMIQYWYVTIPTILVLVGFAYLTWQRDHERTNLKVKSRLMASVKSFAFLAIAFLVVRGGWQTRPLAPAHAYTWQPSVLSNMVLNSGITFLRTATDNNYERHQDFQDMTEIRKILAQPHSQIQTLPLANGKNIVVIVVESLATEYVGFQNGGRGYTPFLDELSKSAVTFNHSFASGRRSIDAIPAIFAGIPSWREQPFITSSYASNEIHPAPASLRKIGYHTMFFHGAANGSMHFDVFAQLAGFDEYIGKSEYPNPADDDGQWGIYDEPFLQFSVDKLTNAPKPFFAGIFTLTSHNPFKIPEQYKNKFAKGTLPIHESIGYADYSLKKFFEKAATKSWYNNTIFVITGDHTSLSDQPEYNGMPGRFRVPILFFDPSGSLPRVESTKIASHVDISPTILELVGAQNLPRGLFGGPLFDRGWSGRFVQREYDTWYYHDGISQIKLTNNNDVIFYGPDDLIWRQPLSSDQVRESQDRLMRFKAVRQYFTNGLLDNNWYKSTPSE